MKKLIIAALAVTIMILLGFMGIQSQSAIGPFLLFVGGCTAIGVTLDIMNALKEHVRKAHLRKLRP